MNRFEHNKNILNSINSFNLLEKVRREAPRESKNITFLNNPPKLIQYKISKNDKINNPYKTVAHIDYIEKYTPPYYGINETGASSISYNEFFK